MAQALLARCHFHGGHDKDLVEHAKVLIADDVYSTGTTARIAIKKLLDAGLRPDSSLIVANPLRVIVDETA